MRRRVAGKACVITGASAGIGEGVARALGARGASLVLAARRLDRLERLTAEIESRGGRAIAVETDVTRASDLGRLLERTSEAFGRCDVLVNNAGIPGGGSFREMTVEQLELVTETNYLSVLRLTKLFLPQLIESRGHVVNVASLAGRYAVPGAAAYSASKHAVVALSESLYHELAPLGVMVTAVNPGFVVTERFRHEALLRDPRTGWLVMTPERTVRAIVGAIAHRKGPEISVPRALGALQAFRLLAPPLYRAAVRRFATGRATRLDP